MSDAKDLTKYPYPNDGYVPFAFNAKKIDEFVNSTEEHTDNRKDRNALTWFGIEEANRRAREALNYKKVEYVADNVIDGLLQYILAPDGNAYVISPDVELPYTLTGDWATDAPNFMLSTDIALRNELSSDSGAEIIGTSSGNTLQDELINISNSIYKSQVVASINELKSIKKQFAKYAVTSGYYSAGDGGSSFYYLDESDTTSADDGGSVIVADDGGRWKLNQNGSVNIRQFGASVNLDDNSEKIQSALFLGKDKGGFTVCFGGGSFKVKSGLRVPSKTIVNGGGAFLVRNSDMEIFIYNDADGVTGGFNANRDIVIHDLNIDANAGVFSTRVEGMDIGHCDNINILRCRFINFPNQWHALEIAGSRGVLVDRCSFESGGGDILNSECIQLDSFEAEAGHPNFGPYDGTSNQFITISNCRIAGWATGIGMHTNPSQKHHTDIRIINCDIRVSLMGIRLIAPQRLLIDGCFISCEGNSGSTTQLNKGVYITNGGPANGTDITISKTAIIGFTRATSASGIEIRDDTAENVDSKMRYVRILDCHINNVSDTGIYVRKILGLEISSNRVAVFRNFGIRVVGAYDGICTRNQVLDNRSSPANNQFISLESGGYDLAYSRNMICMENLTAIINLSIPGTYCANNIVSRTGGITGSPSMSKIGPNLINGTLVP